MQSGTDTSMRRLILLSSLATMSVALTVAPAAAQYTYPTGGYQGVERNGIMTSERNPRQPNMVGVESQQLPPLPGADVGSAPNERSQSTGAQPLPDRQFGGSAPDYRTPQASGHMDISRSEPQQDGRYYSRDPLLPGQQVQGQPLQGHSSVPGQAPQGYQGAYAPPPGYTPPGAHQPGPGYATGSVGDPRQLSPRPPGNIDPNQSPYATGTPAQGAPAFGAPAQQTGSVQSGPGQRPTTIAALPPEDQPEVGTPKALPPQFRRQIVDYETKEPAGTIIIDTPSTFLYYVNGDGTAIRYGIGVGREGFTWAGTERITRMAEWPDWHPPSEMIERQPYLPRFMAGGLSNPMGARALYLGKTIYRVHGTNQPSTIGQYVSSGCIRMLNEDVEDLYTRVKIGTKVVVVGDGKEAANRR